MTEAHVCELSGFRRAVDENRIHYLLIRENDAITSAMLTSRTHDRTLVALCGVKLPSPDGHIYNKTTSKYLDLEQPELAHGRQSVDASRKRRPEGASHVLEGAIQTRVGVPRCVIVSRYVEQHRLNLRWSSSAKPVHTIDGVRRHLLST